MLEILVQTKTGTSNLASTVVTFDNNTVAGNSIVVVSGNSSSTAGDVSGVTDTQGNIYIKDNATANATVGEIEIWHTSGIIGGANTVTVAYTTGVACAVIIREYNGLLYANSLDKQAGTTGNSSALNSGNVNLAQTNELVIGAGLIPLANTFSAGTGFVNLVSAGAPLVVAVAAEDLFTTSGGIQSAAFTANASIQWVCVVATFFLLPTGTTTSTSSTSVSSTSTSISSTSSSTSSTSLSTSSTSISMSTSSTSTSLSSTSSSISSTSSSTSSTSLSSTSSSTSISSTSTSISSTSVSSTSISSTSSSTSVSSTSTSFSSTSSSLSSTSISISSTSFSSTSSSSSTSTTTLPPPYIDYTYQDIATLPTTNTDLVNSFTIPQYSNATGDDGDYQIITGSQYLIKEFKQINKNNTDSINITWKGRTTVPTSVSPLILQIYNQSAGPARVSAHDATGSGAGSATATYPGAPTAGNLLVAVVGDDSGSGIPALTGFSTAFNSATSGSQATIFYKIAAGTEGVITCNYASAGNLSMSIFEYSGISSSPLDQATGTGNGVAGSLTATGATTGTTSTVSELVIAAGFFDTTNPETFASATNSFNQRLSTSPLMVVDKIVSAIGTYTTNITVTGTSATWTSAIATFKSGANPWETIATSTTMPADRDFQVSANQTTNLTNYYDSRNQVSFRVIQKVI